MQNTYKVGLVNKVYLHLNHDISAFVLVLCERYIFKMRFYKTSSCCRTLGARFWYRREFVRPKHATRSTIFRCPQHTQKSELVTSSVSFRQFFSCLVPLDYPMLLPITIHVKLLYERLPLPRCCRLLDQVTFQVSAARILLRHTLLAPSCFYCRPIEVWIIQG
jgi:hypothetical protein